MNAMACNDTEPSINELTKFISELVLLNADKSQHNTLLIRKTVDEGQKERDQVRDHNCVTERADDKQFASANEVQNLRCQLATQLNINEQLSAFCAATPPFP